MRITAKWFDCFLKVGFRKELRTIYEVDNLYYFEHVLKDDDEHVLSVAKSMGTAINRCSKKHIKLMGDPMQALPIIENELPDWKIPCECGSEKVYGNNSTHSDWCPKAIS